jgi:hypothetical protein
MSRKIEMAGKRFGRLVVLSQAGHNPGNHDLLWRCQCDCGNQTVVDGALLRSGQTKSCGCLRREISKQNYVTNTGFVSQMGRAESLVDEQGIPYSSVKKSQRNKSGIVGVSYNKADGKWFARLMYQGHYVLLKSFDTMAEAVQARKLAEKRYWGR